MLSYFISHPEVTVDPAVPIEEWGLSPLGRERADRIAHLPWAGGIERIVSSSERKTMDAAGILGDALGLLFTTDPSLGENDRSATGFLPPAEFEATADQFFARPLLSVRGWETARHAQLRVVAAIRQQVALHGAVETAFVAHGAVGTLLYCDLAGIPISREHDQPGQGSYFAFDPVAWTAAHPWRRID